MGDQNDNYFKGRSIEIVDLSDDDSMEVPVFQSNRFIQINPRKPPTTSQRFERIMLSSEDSEDSEERIIEKSSVSPPVDTFLEKENVPSSIPVNSVRKRFFRWTDQGNSDASTSSISKKRACTTPDERDYKRRSIEYDQQNHSCAIGVSAIVPDVDEIDPNCGRSIEDIGQPTPMVTKHHRLEIAGIKVDFPLSPYPAQKAVMNALIRGCTKEEHVLIESPTGSGKTLALLCGALAWQSHYAVTYQAKRAEFINQTCSSDIEGEIFHNECDNQSNKINESPNKVPTVECPKPVPKIYYGSRTHRQIAQVVKELSRTIYRDAKMTILSSRDFSCIQKTNRNKTELCNELMDPAKKLGCSYYNELNKRDLSNYSNLCKMGLTMPFDVEDLVELGKSRNCCPYFAARNLMLEADLILCPYNYLVDPEIRKSMQIDINGAIIILDEAHNMEDICRDTASVKFKLEEIDIITKECREFQQQKPSDTPAFVGTIDQFCTNFRSMLDQMPLNKLEFQSDTLYSPTWKSTEFRAILDTHRIKDETIERFVDSAKAAIDHYNKVREDMKDRETFTFEHTLSTTTIKILEKFIRAFDKLRSEKFVHDFRVFIKETTEWIFPKETSGNQFKAHNEHRHREQVRTLEVHCMNPGVIFSPIANKARTVILASGTLSPIISFASELETKFKHILQTNHVIPRENVNIKVVSKGPRGTNLRAVYQNTNNWLFLDELARVTSDVCQSVPHGILCFVPSYAFLNKLTDRMRVTGIMKDLEKVKMVYIEPKTSKELVSIMYNYRETIKTCTEEPQPGGITGAILFAVFRGKIAEGIDFSDGESRAVMIIGIPYAVYRDPVVQLKIQYNDEFKQKKDLLKGNEWYTIQAYRALNQALGRCIRHIEDWSSVLLIDERFNVPSNREYLPKWVKTIWSGGMEMGSYSLIDQLTNFSADRAKADEAKKRKSL